MTKIEVELHDDVISIINKLKNIEDTGIELVVPEGAVIFENIINLKLLKSWSDRENKVINFNTNDANGQNMLSYLENGDTPLTESLPEAEESEELEEYTAKRKLKLPKLNFSFFNFRKKGLLIGLVVLLILLGGGFVGYRLLSQKPVASVKIVVNSQPLTRSVEIRAVNGAETNPEEKILQAKTVEASVDDELTIPTTGEETIGEYAEGEITIYNKTDKEKEFKKGTDIIYKNKDDKKFVYETRDDVTVPAAVPGANPGDPITPSGEDVDVKAKEIGEDYNIDKGEDLEVEDQDTSDFEAEVKKDIDGGKEEKVKVVSQEDLDALKKQLAENSEEKAVRALEDSVKGDEKLIKGSQNVAVTKEEYSNELGDQVEEVTLKQTFTAKGLSYKTSDLDNLLDSIVKDFVPEGFVLSNKERVVKVDVLGNTDSTVLSDTESDLQVTLRTFVVTDISEDEVKDNLLGKNISDAEKYLGSIRNVKTYQLNIEPTIPLFNKIPNDKSRINLTLERE